MIQLKSLNFELRRFGDDLIQMVMFSEPIHTRPDHILLVLFLGKSSFEAWSSIWALLI